MVGFQTSGMFHLGHYAILSKLKRYGKAGLECKVWLADLHATLNHKDPRGSVQKMKKFLQAYDPKITPLVQSEVVGLDYLRKVLDASMKLNLVELNRSLPQDLEDQHEEAIRNKINPLLAPYLYVTMQIIDSQFLGCDLVLSGLDQRKIYMRQRQIYPKLGIPTPVMEFVPLLTNPDGSKISKSKGAIPLDSHYVHKLMGQDPETCNHLRFLVESNPWWSGEIGLRPGASYQEVRQHMVWDLDQIP